MSLPRFLLQLMEPRRAALRRASVQMSNDASSGGAAL